jgi:carboxyl-terminal processing protease
VNLEGVLFIATYDDTDDTLVKKPRQRGISILTFCVSLVLALGIGVIVGTRAGQLNLGVLGNNNQTLDLNSVQHTYATLSQNFDGKLDKQKLIEGANRGLVSAAGDQYTDYFNKQEAEQFSDDLSGTFSGIGAELDKRNDKLIIVSPLDNSPAKKAGLKAEDIVAEVNGQDTSSWSIDQAVATIKGKPGSSVKLTILRGSEVKSFTITRATITDPSVTTQQKGSIGIMTISRFGADTAPLVRKAAQTFKDSQVTGVVVDVRGNGGGYLQAAQDVASVWLDHGQVIVTERRDSTITSTERASGDPILKGVPTVVLVDGGSASASEILAGALQDNHAARLVGEKTFGKGSVQTLFDLDYGAKLKVTIAKWYTPGGKNINKQGITPDVAIAVGKNDTKDNDTQLNSALMLLK